MKVGGDFWKIPSIFVHPTTTTSNYNQNFQEGVFWTFLMRLNRP
jgi:hypothetical protein